MKQPAVPHQEGSAIRVITPADAILLATIHREAFGKEGWATEEFVRTLAAPARFGFILRSGPAPVGFVLGQAAGDDAEILTIAVVPRHQRHGYGKYLLQCALDEATQLNAQRLLLEVAADNRAAQALYRKFGFADVGARRGYYKRGAILVDALLLACPLPPAITENPVKSEM